MGAVGDVHVEDELSSCHIENVLTVLCVRQQEAGGRLSPGILFVYMAYMNAMMTI